jgi:magnesium-transporting ATPase (P-type)
MAIKYLLLVSMILNIMFHLSVVFPIEYYLSLLSAYSCYRTFTLKMCRFETFSLASLGSATEINYSWCYFRAVSN